MKKYDFSGYATKNDLKCSDGRTIKKDAFKDNDGKTVPLVWQHFHNTPDNILGHAELENREDGVYAYCKFNDTPSGKNAKLLVEHGDIKAMSIWANNLKQQAKDVVHGIIREVSLVMSGANPGALIDNVNIAHADGTYKEDETEALIYSGFNISTAEIQHEDTKTDGDTVEEIFATLTDKQKDVVYAMLASVSHSEEAEKDDKNLKHQNKGGTILKTNVFDNEVNEEEVKTTLTHDQLRAIMTDAQKCGSFKEAFLSHAQTYGIENIDYLFPDAKTVTPTPDWIKRDTGWVSGVINGTHHTPFSRIKSTAADITAEEARARGYIKGSLKKEEIFKLLKRVTGPTTIYKKQKLDRDDIIDITDLDVVSWLKAEMRMMLDEEIARAALVGDGRDPESEDKINEECIRPIYKDDDMYAHKVAVAADADIEDIIESIIRSRKNYKGSGNPTLYTTTEILTDMLLVKDTIGHRIYKTEAELASALRVSRIVEVPVMGGLSRETEDETPVTLDLLAIMVNLKDYTMGADKGGNVSMFDDFDIDYNQYKYLIETRCSGALIHPKSALVIEQARA